METIIKFWPWAVIVIGIVLIAFLSRVRRNHYAQADFEFKAPIKTKGWGLALSKLTHNQLMSSIISLVVLFSALYVILSGSYAESEQKWAFGAIGTIMGFWLKPDK